MSAANQVSGVYMCQLLEQRKPSHMHLRAVCPLIGLGDLLAVCCEGTSPLPKTFMMTINAPCGILNGFGLAGALAGVPWDQRDSSCCSRTEHLAER